MEAQEKGDIAEWPAILSKIYDYIAFYVIIQLSNLKE